MLGYTYSNDVDISKNKGECDYWIVKLDNSGNMKWEKSFGGSSTEYASDVVQTSYNEYIISGSSASNSFLHVLNKCDYNLLIIKIKDNSIEIGNSKNISKTIHIFPNPSNQNVSITFDNNEKSVYTLIIYDEFGQRIKTISNISSGEIKLEKNELK